MRWVAPGPPVARHTPSSPVNLAWATAMKRRHLLVPRLDEVDVAVALERADHAVDAVARIAENPADAPGLEPVDEEIRVFMAGNAASRRCDAPRTVCNCGVRRVAS